MVDVGARARRRAVSGFCLYDVANSAFVTVVVTAVGGPFVVAVAKAAETGGRVSLLGLRVAPGAVYGYAVSLSVLLQVVVLPLLGARADAAGGKRALLTRSTAVGVLATLALSVVPFGHPLLAVLAFLVANVAFGAGVLAYNSFLGDVADPADSDRVSARAFAFGYAGGGLVLAVDLVLLEAHGALGLSQGDAVRVAIAGAGLWWGAVGALSARRLRAVEQLGLPAHAVPGGAVGPVRQLRASLQAVRELPGTARFLVAFLLFNDAVQAVVTLSAVVLTQELYVAKGRPAADATAFLLQLVLLIQVVAVVGATLSARLARVVGAKTTVLLELVVWTGVVLYAVVLLRTTTQAYGLGVVIALVLGGTQSLARSMFSRMVPAARQAACFGFYELAERGTAWIGTLVFSVVLDVTGSYRRALLSLLVLFVAGGSLLAVTDTGAAEVAARAMDAEDERRAVLTAGPRSGAS